MVRDAWLVKGLWLLRIIDRIFQGRPWLRTQTSIEKWSEEEDERLLSAIKKPLGCGESVVELAVTHVVDPAVGHILVLLSIESRSKIQKLATSF